MGIRSATKFKVSSVRLPSEACFMCLSAMNLPVTSYICSVVFRALYGLSCVISIFTKSFAGLG